MTRNTFEAKGDRSLEDTEVLDGIAVILSGDSWSPDTLDAIADLVRSTGREVLDQPENDNG